METVQTGAVLSRISAQFSIYAVVCDFMCSTATATVTGMLIRVGTALEISNLRNGSDLPSSLEPRRMAE